jgi:transcriptional antiterminator RfaH
MGVSRLVMSCDQPHAVPRGVVEALIEATDARGILQLGSKLRLGGPVRLIAGPFAQQLATLDHLGDSGRVRVLLHILGRQVAISTKVDNVLPLLQIARKYCDASCRCWRNSSPWSVARLCA